MEKLGYLKFKSRLRRGPVIVHGLPGAQSHEPFGQEGEGVAVAVKISMRPLVGIKPRSCSTQSVQFCLRSRRSSVGIATPYWLDGPGFADWCVPPPSLLYHGYMDPLPGLKRRVLGCDIPPRSKAKGKKNEWSYTSTSPLSAIRGML